MKTVLSQLFILILGQPAGNVPIDVAPPVGALVGISVAALAVLCLLVVGIILAAVLIIRRIKKNRAAQGPSALEQK